MMMTMFLCVSWGEFYLQEFFLFSVVAFSISILTNSCLILISFLWVTSCQTLCMCLNAVDSTWAHMSYYYSTCQPSDLTQPQAESQLQQHHCSACMCNMSWLLKIWTVLPTLYCPYSSCCTVWTISYVSACGCSICNLIMMCFVLMWYTALTDWTNLNSPINKHFSQICLFESDLFSFCGWIRRLQIIFIYSLLYIYWHSYWCTR